MAPDHIITILSAADEDDASRSPFTGVPMKILAVDIPFLAVDVLAGNGGRLIIDTRLHSFMELKPEFAAVFKQPEPESSPEAIRLPFKHTTAIAAGIEHAKHLLEEAAEEAERSAKAQMKIVKRAAITIGIAVFFAGIAIGFAAAHL